MGKIFDLLAGLGLTSETTCEQFATGTRDNPDLPVYRDSESGVIFIDNFYLGDQHYENSSYLGGVTKLSHERSRDCARRVNEYAQFYYDRAICDVGCGAGDFLKAVKPYARSVSAVELQEKQATQLEKHEIPCRSKIEDFPNSFDTIFCFHALEHFVNPIDMLLGMKSCLAENGQLIIEVPHAKDFLLSTLANESFKSHTLWSPHLILHTRESLTRLLQASGFKNIIVEGVQRYPLSNHLTWLSQGKAGGHLGPLSVIDTNSLNGAYAESLQKIDATDTLVAWVGNGS